MEKPPPTTSAENYEHALQAFYKVEGTYILTDTDPPQEKYKGIRRDFYPDLDLWQLIDSSKQSPNFPSILELDRQLQREVKDFYFMTYWKPSKLWRLAELNQDISAELFQMCIHITPRHAIALYQKALNILNKNGITYPTIETEGKMDDSTVITTYRALKTTPPKQIIFLMRILEGMFYIDLWEKADARKLYNEWIDRLTLKQNPL